MVTLTIIVLSGLAVNYVAELIALITGRIFSRIPVINVAILPLSILACWLQNVVGFELVISAAATAFIASSLRLLLDAVTSKPQIISSNNRRY